jgi:hypothetical protein
MSKMSYQSARVMCLLIDVGTGRVLRKQGMNRNGCCLLMSGQL